MGNANKRNLTLSLVVLIIAMSTARFVLKDDNIRNVSAVMLIVIGICIGVLMVNASQYFKTRKRNA